MNILQVFSLVLASGYAYTYNENNTLGSFDDENFDNKGDTVLSRSKRFIVFPDGSSFQLVFCTQNHGFLQVGDIVWFGNTAALAWELPTDPEVFYMFKERKKIFEGNRRNDKHVVYFDEKGKVVAKVPYRRKPIVNPAFAKRSVDQPAMFKRKLHERQKTTDHLSGLSENSVEFHRTGRKELYEKIESFFEALGWNGRECVLRILCETKRERKNQGAFLEEIMRATFTLPKGRDFESDYHKAYDLAHGSHGLCDYLYPHCKDLHGLKLFENKLAI